MPSSSLYLSTKKDAIISSYVTILTPNLIPLPTFTSTHTYDEISLFFAPVVGATYYYSLNDGETYTQINTITNIEPNGTLVYVIGGITQASVILKLKVNTIASLGQSIVLKTAPSAPTLFSVSASNQSALLLFSGANANGSAITKYQYSFISGGANTNFVDITSSDHVITGLTNGNTYVIVLRAVNVIGNSPNTNSVSFIPSTIPAPPSISVSPGYSSVSVSFTPGLNDGGSPITSYRYLLNGILPYVDLGLPNNPFIISGLTPEQIHTVQLDCVNTNGDSLDTPAVSFIPSISYLINTYNSFWVDASSNNYTLSGSNILTVTNKSTSTFAPLSKSGNDIPYVSTSPKYFNIVPGSALFQNTTPYYSMTTVVQTWFMVVQFPSAIVGTEIVALLGPQTTPLAQAYGYNVLATPTRFQINPFGTANYIGFDNTWNTSNKYLISISLNTAGTLDNASSNSIMRLNGSNKTKVVSGGTNFFPMGTNTVSRLWVGGGNYNGAYYGNKPMYLHEAILMNNVALGINDVRTIETYLNNKWSLGYTIS